MTEEEKCGLGCKIAKAKNKTVSYAKKAYNSANDVYTEYKTTNEKYVADEEAEKEKTKAESKEKCGIGCRLAKAKNKTTSYAKRAYNTANEAYAEYKETNAKYVGEGSALRETNVPAGRKKKKSSPAPTEKTDAPVEKKQSLGSKIFRAIGTAAQNINENASDSFSLYDSPAFSQRASSGFGYFNDNASDSFSLYGRPTYSQRGSGYGYFDDNPNGSFSLYGNPTYPQRTSPGYRSARRKPNTSEWDFEIPEGYELVKKKTKPKTASGRRKKATGKNYNNRM